MPKQSTIKRARKAKRQGKAPTTQASEYVREEIEEIRKGTHGARSAKQAIAIGLSKARRAGVKLPTPKKGKVSESTRRKAERDSEAARTGRTRSTSRKRSRATLAALKREPRSTVSRAALSNQAKTAAKKRTKADRSASAKKAARTRARHK